MGQTTTAYLNLDTYKQGLLVNEDVMAGVVELPGGQFAVFATELVSARTTHYKEFGQLDHALEHANSLAPDFHFEAFGCAKGPACAGARKGSCPSCQNNTHATGC